MGEYCMNDRRSIGRVIRGWLKSSFRTVQFMQEAIRQRIEESDQ